MFLDIDASVCGFSGGEGDLHASFAVPEPFKTATRCPEVGGPELLHAKAPAAPKGAAGAAAAREAAAPKAVAAPGKRWPVPTFLAAAGGNSLTPGQQSSLQIRLLAPALETVAVVASAAALEPAIVPVPAAD